MKPLFSRYLFLLIFSAIGLGLSLMVCAQSDRIWAHDPVAIEYEDRVYLFTTGHGISVWSSDDMKSWKKEPKVFEEEPKWAVEAVPTFKNHIWAPDISFHEGTFYLYYSISAFGKNTSAIGLATNKSLDPNHPDYKWVDHGKVIQSVPGKDLWNAIDPNLVEDEEGNAWLNFGSFWNGMKMFKLDEERKAPAKPEEWYTIASRERSFGLHDSLPGDNAIEAPFIYQKGDHYYLFVSFDYCCRGKESTYKIAYGRSESVTGPYLDQEGKELNKGGGTILMEGDDDWHGLGHNAVSHLKGKDYLLFHGYDAHDDGKSKLRIFELKWDEDQWLSVGDEVY